RHTSFSRDWSSDVCSSDLFSQADLTVPSEYEGRTPILFWAPFTGVNYEVLAKQFAAFNESQDEIVAIAESVGGYADLNQKFTARSEERRVGKECRAGEGQG